jgi:hypothetical protein
MTAPTCAAVGIRIAAYTSRVRGNRTRSVAKSRVCADCAGEPRLAAKSHESEIFAAWAAVADRHMLRDICSAARPSLPFHAKLVTDVQWAAIRALAVRPHRIRPGRPRAGFKI